MDTSRFVVALAAVLLTAGAAGHESAAAGIDPGRALDPGLGRLHHPVSTRNLQAQAFFDQGMKLLFAFNHEGAIAAFSRAAQLDPDLAMAHWGIAYALGPNYNIPMSPEAHKEAYAALTKAIALKDKASARERDYIDALSKRYASDPQADVAPLNLAYKDAMAALARRYPNDVDAQVLYAESLMDLRPWKLWKPDGTPEDGTPEIIAVLQRALKLNPDHPGANHYYIHALEMSPHPERALAAARRLETLAPSAGHLVHMPAHAYVRTGDYLAAERVNERAAHADERLRAAGVHSLYTVGYYGHNLHFLAVSAALAGNAAKSIAAARKLADVVKPQLKDVPLLDVFYATPEQVLVLFDRWDDVLTLEEPPFEAPFSVTMYHFARALAFAAQGRADESKAERAKFGAMVAATGKTVDLGNNSALAVLAVATPYLDGRLALLAGDLAGAVASLRQAAAAEEALAYDEPPGWYLGSNWLLGTALLRAGDAAGAEQAFRADLKHNVASGRSLHGLRAALAAQGKTREAAAVQKRFVRAWRRADVKLAAQ
jgi:hypothetical protein